MNRTLCRLPVHLAHLCESGCIYREKAFLHLQCPFVTRKDICAAPCKPECSCTHPPPQNGHTLPKPKDKKNEVLLL